MVEVKRDDVKHLKATFLLFCLVGAAFNVVALSGKMLTLQGKVKGTNR
jgi:hypothetical protein